MQPGWGRNKYIRHVRAVQSEHQSINLFTAIPHIVNSVEVLFGIRFKFWNILKNQTLHMYLSYQVCPPGVSTRCFYQVCLQVCPPGVPTRCFYQVFLPGVPGVPSRCAHQVEYVGEVSGYTVLLIICWISGHGPFRDRWSLRGGGLVVCGRCLYKTFHNSVICWQLGKRTIASYTCCLAVSLL